MEIVLFGSGECARQFIREIDGKDFKIEYIYDNDKSKSNKNINGINIISIDSLKGESKNKVIIITSIYIDEIKYQLDNLGFHNSFFYKDFLYCIRNNIKLKYLKNNQTEIGVKRLYKEKFNIELENDDKNSFRYKVNMFKINGHLYNYKDYADKVKAKDIVREKVGEEYIIKNIGIFNTIEEIEFDKLPNKFVIKLNHGCGQNIIIKDKSYDIEEIKKKLRRWKESNYYWRTYEEQYISIEPKIIIEEYIEDINGNLIDYKFYCNNGKVDFIQIDYFRSSKHLQDFYNDKLEKIGIKGVADNSDIDLKKKDCIMQCKEIVEVLAKDFKFVRIDFYIVNEKIYFGEYTLTPHSGMIKFLPKEFDLQIIK